MRRTRFIKLEVGKNCENMCHPRSLQLSRCVAFVQVLRRLFAEDGEAFRPGLEDFRDETLSQPLTNALAQGPQMETGNGTGMAKIRDPIRSNYPPTKRHSHIIL